MNTRVFLFALLFVALHAMQLNAQKADRSGPPALGDPPQMKLPPIQRSTLSNGMEILLMEKRQVPLLQINIVFLGGTASDPLGSRGLANLAASMMMEGAGGKSALELADAIDVLGARIGVSAGRHSTALRLRTPVSKLDDALPLLADIAMRPSFPGEELERLRKQRLTTLLQWRDETRSIASVLFDRTLYGEEHPYGHPSIGDETSIRSMETSDLQSWHRNTIHPGNAVAIAAGDITMNDLRHRLEVLFGSWEGNRAETPVEPELAAATATTIYLVDKPGAAQSEIRIGRVGAARSTSDYYALLVMNTILGGSFTSRLNHNLREEHGYTYGARSSFSFRRWAGPFMAGAAVQTAVTAEALTEFLKELRGILETVPEEELGRAKNYLAFGYPSSFETVAGIASRLENLRLHELPESYFNDFTGNVLAVSAGDVRRVSTKYIKTDGMAIVVVGDRKVIEEGIRSLNLAPIEFLTIEEVLGKAPELK